MQQLISTAVVVRFYFAVRFPYINSLFIQTLRRYSASKRATHGYNVYFSTLTIGQRRHVFITQKKNTALFSVVTLIMLQNGAFHTFRFILIIFFCFYVFTLIRILLNRERTTTPVRGFFG